MKQRKDAKGKAMKTAMINLLKASLTMVAGWAVAGWMLLALLASLSLIT